jgi:hypothetical protein
LTVIGLAKSARVARMRRSEVGGMGSRCETGADPPL